MESVNSQSEVISFQIDNHIPLLHRIVKSRVPNGPVEDIVQEVLVSATESDNFPVRDEEQQRWLCRVAVRKCALYWRKQSRDQNDQKLQSVADDSLADPIHWLIARESVQQMKDAIAQLDDESKRLLLMKFVDKRTYEDIADDLQITRHAAEYRVQSAKRALQSTILKMGINEVEQ